MRFRFALIALSLIPSGPVPARTDCPVADQPVVVEQRGGGKVSYWLEGPLKRVFPATPPGFSAPDLVVARNGRASFQSCVRNDRVRPLDIECTVPVADGLRPRVRWVGIVPVRHRTPETAPYEAESTANIPGMVPDPLMPQSRATVGSFESRSFWVTLDIPADARPGLHKLTVRLAPKDGGEPSICLWPSR